MSKQAVTVVCTLFVILMLATSAAYAYTYPTATCGVSLSNGITTYSYTVVDSSGLFLDKFHVFAPISQECVSASPYGLWTVQKRTPQSGITEIFWSTANPDDGIFYSRVTLSFSVNVPVTTITNYDPAGVGSNWAYELYPQAGEYWGTSNVAVPMAAVPEPSSILGLMIGVTGLLGVVRRAAGR